MQGDPPELMETAEPPALMEEGPSPMSQLARKVRMGLGEVGMGGACWNLEVPSEPGAASPAGAGGGCPGLADAFIPLHP